MRGTQFTVSNHPTIGAIVLFPDIAVGFATTNGMVDLSKTQTVDFDSLPPEVMLRNTNNITIHEAAEAINEGRKPRWATQKVYL